MLSACLGEEKPVTVSDWAAVFALAKRHCVAAMVCSVAQKNGCPPELLKAWTAYKNNVLRKSVLFEGERNAILKEADRLGVRYIPLKGVVLCKLYPEPYLREFADNDLFFVPQDEGKIKKIMLSRGYTVKGCGGGVWEFLKSPVYNFEWHRLLLPEKNAVGRYFRKAANRTERSEVGKLRFAAEDDYLYFLAHLQKHYLNSGTGLRSFVDLHLYRKSLSKNPSFSKEKFEKTAKETGMSEFEKEMGAFADALFLPEGALPCDRETELYVYSSGTYGLARNAVQHKVRQKGKTRFYFEWIFRPYSNMLYEFPILKKVPVLLPVFWLWRGVRLIFQPQRRKKVRENLDYIKKMDRKEE